MKSALNPDCPSNFGQSVKLHRIDSPAHLLNIPMTATTLHDALTKEPCTTEEKLTNKKKSTHTATHSDTSQLTVQHTAHLTKYSGENQTEKKKERIKLSFNCFDVSVRSPAYPTSGSRHLGEVGRPVTKHSTPHNPINSTLGSLGAITLDLGV